MSAWQQAPAVSQQEGQQGQTPAWQNAPAVRPLSQQRTGLTGTATDQGRALPDAQRAAFNRVPGGYDPQGELGSARTPLPLREGDDGTRLQIGQFGITTDGRYVEGTRPVPVPMGQASRGQGRPLVTEGAQLANQLNRAIPGASELAGLTQAGVNAAQDLFAGRPVGSFNDYWTGARDEQAMMQQDFLNRRPIVANLATGTPGAMMALAPGLNAAAQSTRLGNIVAGAGLGAASGGVAGYAQPGNLEQRANNAYAGMALGGVLGGAVGRFTPLPAAQQPRMPQQARDMMMAGVDLTPGQMMGGAWRANEERLRSVPVLGDAIGEAEQRGIEQFNRIATNRALAPIGQQLPENVQTGRPAIGFAQQAIGSEFDQIARQATLRPDEQLASDLQAAVARVNPTLPPEQQRQLQSIVDNTVIGRMQMAGGVADGRTLQEMNSGLREMASGYMGSANPDQRSIGQALEAIRRSVDNAVIRQNPELARPMVNARAAYSQLPRLERAAASAGARDGIATPNQFAAAGRAEDRTLRRRATAAGRVPNQPFFEAAQATLSSRVPDSGTAGRGAVLAGLAGTGTAIAAPEAAPAVIATGATLLGSSAIYSAPVLRALNTLARGQVSRRDATIARQALMNAGLTPEQIAAGVTEIRNRAAFGAGAIAAPENTATSQTAGR